MNAVRPVRLPPQFRFRGDRVGGCRRCGGDIIEDACFQCGWEQGFWPRDFELAAKAIREGRRAVPLAGGSILYVKEKR